MNVTDSISENSKTARSLSPGTIVGGKYEVIRCLGQGSMGLVYACKHIELEGLMVALKVLFPEVADDKIAAARFRNEVVASLGVSHQNVVRAQEYIKDGELVAYAMEYVDGGDLADVLGSSESVEIKKVVDILSQITAGVQAIHDSGIVHRDLKPENILLTKEGEVKITDFGIARLGSGPRLTEHGGVVGTIDYVAPEYMLESKVDWRSDIYAIGILSYELVAGQPPFRGDSVYSTMTMRLKTDPEPPSKHRSDCPKSLDKIILKAMSRKPEERYQSASQMFYDLQLISNQSKQDLRSGAYHQLPPQAGNDYVGPALGEDMQSVQVDDLEEIPTTNRSGLTQDLSPRANTVRDALLSDLPTSIFDSPNTAFQSKKSDNVEGSKSDTGHVVENSFAEIVNIEEFYKFRNDLRSNEIKDTSDTSADTDEILEYEVNETAFSTNENTFFGKFADSAWLDIGFLILAMIFGVALGVIILRMLVSDF